MRPRYLFASFLFIVISGFIFGIRAAGFGLRHIVAPTNSPIEKVAPVERVEAQVYTSGLISTPTEPAVTLETRQEDGLALIKSHCTQCHQAEWILQVDKSRPDWEKTLDLMGAMGVHLEDSEKDILLNFLATADKS